MEIIIKRHGRIIKEFDCQKTASAWCKEFGFEVEKWVGPRGHYQEWVIS